MAQNPGNERDYDSRFSETPDIASQIDKNVEIAAERYGVSLRQAAIILRDFKNIKTKTTSATFAQALGFMLYGRNPIARAYGLLFAVGMDKTNPHLGNQSDVARRLGVTRALISHYRNEAASSIGNDKRKKDKQIEETDEQARPSPFITIEGITKAFEVWLKDAKPEKMKKTDLRKLETFFRQLLKTYLATADELNWKSFLHENRKITKK